MDAYYPPYRQELNTSPPRSSTKFVLAHLYRSRMTLRFSCRSVYHTWIPSRDSTELQLVDEFELPLVTKSINCKINTRKALMMDTLEVMDKIIKGLAEFPLLFMKRLELITIVAQTVGCNLVKSMPLGHNHWDIDFDFTLLHEHVLDGGRMIRAPGPAMIPAIDASIDSLENVSIDLSKQDCKCCTICLEDFITGCEGVCMPCSHIFHGVCIRKWLKTSHFCPVCRFEMPTN